MRSLMILVVVLVVSLNYGELLAAPPAAPHEALKSSGQSTGMGSLYDKRIRIPLTDQDGVARQLDQFRGEVTLISMFFTHCAYVCPLLIAKLKALEDQLKPEELSKLRVMLVSFDAERDLPEQLKKTAVAQKIDESRWRLLHAKEGEVRTLSALLGIAYHKTAEGDFNHSTAVTLLSRQGEIIGSYDGTQSPPDSFMALLQQQLKAK